MAPPSKKPSRPGGSSPRQGNIVSRPGRYLAALVAMVIVMLASVIGGAALHPGDWHSKFKVGLGLDLSSGTTLTLRAVNVKHTQPSPDAMKQAISIMLSRVNGAGFTGAQVQQQGADIIVVSVPGQNATKVVNLVGTTAQLRFRQVLLVAPGYPITVTPTPSPTPTPGASGSPSVSPSVSASSSASPRSSASSRPSASPKPSASRKAATRSSGNGLAGRSVLLANAGRASAKPSGSASPKPSASPKATPTPSPSASPSTTTRLPTVADAQGDVTMVHSPAVIREFNALNCRDKNWQSKIYGNDPTRWDDKKAQIVACDSQGFKYVLDVAKVAGTDLSSVGALLESTTNQWVVNFNLKGSGATAFGTLTSDMYTKYYSAQDAAANLPQPTLDRFAIVLDGKVVSAPDVIAPITTGSGQITGNFTQKSAGDLANVLKYGALPLAFKNESTSSVSAQLGASQLTAGLIAAAIGLLLVVIYSFLYYRGLGVVSVSSLAIAALLSWLSVILLSKYQGFTLSLAGVAGLIVAIGITADSFVVYFERLRDEVREGRSLRAAVERGWQRARRTILVSDTVSFLAAALLYIFAIGDVRGFAFTLGLTTIIDIVVVFLFTKPMVTLLARTKFYGQGHRMSGLDPARLGAKSPWRGSRPATVRPATGGAATATSALAARTTPKEA